ncbi:MAG: hypothetical protein ACOYMA_00740 [Bacteroidia bacterium]
MPHKKTIYDFIENSNKIHNNKYDYSKSIYVNSRTLLTIICKEHGPFELRPAVHLAYKRGCGICNNTKNNNDSFVKKAINIHGDSFDYSKVEYKSAREKVCIICPQHGEFHQTPDKHINFKQKCPKCDKTCKKNSQMFFDSTVLIHGDKYDYSKVNYVNFTTKVEIICKAHGSFLQTPQNHIYNKQSCEKCAFIKSRLTKEEFIEKANKIHKNKYNYDKSVYNTLSKKIEIICKKHGSFWQNAQTHLIGSGCNICSRSISLKEVMWLNILNMPKEYRQKTLQINNKIYRVDAYNPETNTIYEFYGDFWHGNINRYNPLYVNNKNKKSFISLYNETVKREAELKEAGYNIITIWESDFEKLYNVKR